MRVAVAVALAGAAVASAGLPPHAPQRRARTWHGVRSQATLDARRARAEAKAAAGGGAAPGKRVGGPTTGGMWPQEHFDMRNSGSSTYNGPGDTIGFCHANLQKNVPVAGATGFASTGVTSLSDTSAWFGGGDDNVLQLTQVYSLSSSSAVPLNLSTLNPRGYPLSPWGIQASGVVYLNDIGDNIAQPSADGTVYTVWWLSCLAQVAAHDAMPHAFAMHPLEAERRAMEQGPPSASGDAGAPRTWRVNAARARELMFVHKEAAVNVTDWMLGGEGSPFAAHAAKWAAAGRPASNLTDFPTCLQWAATMNYPSLGPTRYMDYVPNYAGQGIVLATESDDVLDTGGALHAFDSITGQHLWKYEARDAAGNWFGLKGIVPAVDEIGLSDGGVFLAFGTRLVALAPDSGAVLVTLDTAANAGDPYVTSPVLDILAENVYIHSVSGTLWRVAIAGGDPDPLTLTLMWGCDYVVGAGGNMSDCQPPPAAFTKQLKSARVDTATGLNIVGWDAISRSDYVNGGFYQPTTKAQRAELYDALLAAHAAATGAPDYASPAARAAAVAALRPEDAAALARQLPRETVFGLVTPSGYRRLGPNGKPVPPRHPVTGMLTLAGTIPLATPAIDESIFSLDDSLVVPQFLPFGTGEEGVFVVRSDTGSVLWGLSQWTTADGTVVPFGRSRSSPAIDGDDFIYVGTDIDDPLAPGSSIPVLFALDGLSGDLVWGTTMGFEPNVTIGTASPAVIDGYDDGNYALMSASDGVVQVGEGISCPTDDAAFECSGHGDCDCTAGVCTCTDAPCFGGSSCSNICKHGGKCDSTLGGCVCPPNYDAASMCAFCDPCHAGPDSGCVEVANKCNLHGTCVVAGGLPTCQCDKGWGGMGCTERDAAITVAETVDVGAAVGVPLALLAVGFAGLAVWKRRNPGAQLSDLVPGPIKSFATRGRSRTRSKSAGFIGATSADVVVTQSAAYGSGTGGGGGPAPTKGSEGSKLMVGKTYGAL